MTHRTRIAIASILTMAAIGGMALAGATLRTGGSKAEAVPSTEVDKPKVIHRRKVKTVRVGGGVAGYQAYVVPASAASAPGGEPNQGEDEDESGDDSVSDGSKPSQDAGPGHYEDDGDEDETEDEDDERHDDDQEEDD